MSNYTLIFAQPPTISVMAKKPSVEVVEKPSAIANISSKLTTNV